MGWTRKRVQDSGWRDITSLIPDVISGTAHLRRSGNVVSLRLAELVVADPANSWATWTGILPAGFRLDLPGFSYFSFPATSSIYTAGPVRMDRTGGIVVYGVQGGKRMAGTITWIATGDMPANLPGASA